MVQIRYLLLVTAISVLITTSSQCSYEKCIDPWSQNITEHTMCLYSATEFGAECNIVKFPSLSGEEQKEILDRHNELRAKIAAGKETRGQYGGQPAGIIGRLSWDDELASIAQRWANQCIDGHDKCRGVKGADVGQNVGYAGHTGHFSDSYVGIVTAWYDEIDEFDHKLVPNYQSSSGITTHFTQLIWANSTRVGCGGIKYVSKDEYFTFHLVCNYSPKGNWIGEAVYRLRDNSAVDLPDESDLESPPELADEPSNQPNVETRANIPTLQTHEIPANAAPWRNHAKSQSDEYMRGIRSHIPIQPALKVPRIDARMGQGCKYSACRNPEAPGQYMNHTMCRYPDNNLGGQCTHVQKSSLDSAEKNAILDIHNEERGELKTGPGSSRLASLKWNTELADIAQRWANQCHYYHDECRDIRGIEVGQNVGAISNVERFTPFPKIVRAWYAAIKHYNSHYPNLIWADTTDVGCGGIEYIEPDGSFKTFLVCNYISERNVDREPIRTTSKPQRSALPFINARIGSNCRYNRCEDPRVRGKYEEHTMCRYTHPNTAVECNDVRQPFVSAAEQREILQSHNALRHKSGRNIRALRWNDQLAIIAQRWANQCRVGNDACRDLDHTSHVGQNFGMLGWKHAFLYEFSDVVSSWNSKTAPRNAHSESRHVSNPAEGSYLQIISGNTTDVGCGGVKYVDTQGYHNTYLVCNYSPSGNHHVHFAYDVHGSVGAES